MEGGGGGGEILITPISPSLDIPLSADKEEMFRSTGQSSSNRPTSAEPQYGHPPVNFEPQSRPQSSLREPPKSPHRTFSEEVEEERTAGSGTDLMTEQGECPVGGGADAVSEGAAEEGSQDVSNEEDEHVERTQVLEGGDVSGADEEVGAASGEEGSPGSSKEKEGKEQSEVEKVADANPAYAKYLLEKRQMSEELKQRSE